MILRHDSLTKSVIEGDVEGHIGRAGPRVEYMGKTSYKELKELNNDMDGWRTTAKQSSD